MLPTLLSYVPVILCLYGIGTLALLKNSRSFTNVCFALFTFSLATWQLSLFFADFLLNAGVALWALRTASVFGTLISPLFLLLCTVFPLVSGAKSRRFGAWYFLPAAIFVALSYTPLIVPAIEIRDNSAQIVGAGLLYSLQSLYIVIGFLIGVVLLFLKLRYKDISARHKRQIFLVMGGIMVAVLINIVTNVVLILLNLGNSFSNFISTLSFLVFVAATAYAIIRHRLFDIRLAIARTVGFLITVFIVATLYSLLVIGISAPFINQKGGAFENRQLQILLLLPPTIFIGLTFHSIQQFIARFTRRIFYQDSYDLRDTLDKFSDALVAANEFDEIMGPSIQVITDAIKPSNSYFAIFNDEGGLSAAKAESRDHPDIVALLPNIKRFRTNPAVYDEMETNSLAHSYMKEDISLALLLGSRAKPTGLVLFGPKQNGRIYTQTDIDLLRIGSKNLTVAIENAKKYDQISHFADTLRDEVQRATAKLRRANEQLKTLDALKDDFMSMASHQLRSPATSVHEALHMLNHPALNQEDREQLVSLAEASSERLVTVVKTMLNMARLQAGRFTIDRSEIDIVALAAKVIDQTGVLAEEKSIDMKFKKPKKPVHVAADEAKISEAMANYIENAIKYSPKGSSVTVTLDATDKKITFEVKDSGMGVPEEERQRLFGKFYRATNAREEQPDGNGVGLYVVKSIAEGHGGEAYYKPQTEGSLFGFWIVNRKK